MSNERPTDPSSFDVKKSIFGEKAWLHNIENADKSLPPKLLIPHKSGRLWFYTLLTVLSALFCVSLKMPITFKFVSLPIKISQKPESYVELFVHSYPPKFTKYLQKGKKMRLINTSNNYTLIIQINDLKVPIPQILFENSRANTIPNPQDQVIFIEGILESTSTLNLTAEETAGFYDVTLVTDNDNILSSVLLKSLH